MGLLLELRGVSKSFGAVRALRDVSLELHAGEIHAVAGENGAGKSTVVRIIGGEHQPDTGELLLDGTPIRFTGPRDAQQHGIAVIHQEPSRFPDLSAAENVFIGRQPFRVDRAGMRRRAAELFARLGVRIDPDRPTRGLSIADQQVIEIARALAADAGIIVMDEPTAALSEVEAQRLFRVARDLAGNGAAVLFISHRLNEIYTLCDRITVLRDGQLAITAPSTELDRDALVRSMVGRPVNQLFPERHPRVGADALAVTGLSRSGRFADVSLTVRRGEIVGLAGLVGSGRSDVARAIFGVDKPDSGTITVNGRDVPPGNPRAAMDAGVAMVPEDRREQGLIPELSIERNTGLPRLRDMAVSGVLIRRDRERALATEWTRRLSVRYGRLTDPVTTLSGGNQQKVVLGKWLAGKPTVLIVDEPTRGIDVGAKHEVHTLLSDLADAGLAVLMISSELPEVLGMSDRILVMHEGRIAAELSRSEATEEAVMRAATGTGS